MNNEKLKQDLIDMFGSRCMLCGDTIQQNEEKIIHNLYPILDSGIMTVKNSVILCKYCNFIIHMNSYKGETYQRYNELIKSNKALYKKYMEKLK